MNEWSDVLEAAFEHNVNIDFFKRDIMGVLRAEHAKAFSAFPVGSVVRVQPHVSGLPFIPLDVPRVVVGHDWDSLDISGWHRKPHPWAPRLLCSPGLYKEQERVALLFEDVCLWEGEIDWKSRPQVPSGVQHCESCPEDSGFIHVLRALENTPYYRRALSPLSQRFFVNYIPDIEKAPHLWKCPSCGSYSYFTAMLKNGGV